MSSYFPSKRLALLAAAALLGCAQVVFAADSSTDAAKLAKTRELIQSQNSETTTPNGKSLGEWRTASTPIEVGAGTRMLQGLFLCCGLLLIGSYFYRKVYQKGGQPLGRRVRIIERLPIAAKTSLLLVEFDGQSILLSVGSEAANVVSRQGPAASDAKRKTKSPSGKKHLAEFVEIICQEDKTASASS